MSHHTTRLRTELEVITSFAGIIQEQDAGADLEPWLEPTDGQRRRLEILVRLHQLSEIIQRQIADSSRADGVMLQFESVLATFLESLSGLHASLQQPAGTHEMWEVIRPRLVSEIGELLFATNVQLQKLRQSIQE